MIDLMHKVAVYDDIDVNNNMDASSLQHTDVAYNTFYIIILVTKII